MDIRRARTLAAAALTTGLLIAPTMAPAQEQERQPWTVDHTWTDTKEVRFTVDEGTWMSVDVSPDGTTLVFDLLGDIYTLPIQGGEATRISGGPAFDFHPRFSPDGRHIAFVSDRDGLNNIWVMGPDGSNPVQVTKERDRDVNSPEWSTEGEYLFVRKHFVFSRSLGAGEIWMYHRTGGTGLQVTDRPNEQQDQGEPAASPDGEWVYYSQDVTPGPLFQYNKDPNPGIYAIRRRHLVTGEEETVVRGPGGAITPVPHPDGRHLAFIRRVRENTVLFLKDLESGAEWPVFDGLEHDMQEAWAIHGPYARYDWVPGTNQVAIWAGGKLWRIDTETGEAANIPFTAEVDVRVQEAVRFPVEVAPDQVEVKMLRHAVTSPDGSRVAFSALGRLWVTDAGGGEPRRLTSADEVEAFPRWSPDGRQIVYASWDDETMGAIKVVPVRGGSGRAVTSEPGHYVAPAFSPDGSRIVYQRIGGDDRRGQLYTDDRGIWLVPAAGGEAVRVREGGSSPVFSVDGTRILFQQGGVRSVDLDGTDEVTHLTGSEVLDWALSPDGEWVAFTEGWRTYLARFPRPGRTVSVSAGTNAYPVRQISEESGAFLHWSDSETVHWMRGPEYFTRDVSVTFPFVEGGPEEDAAEPETAGVDLGFTVPRDVPTGTVAFTGATIITAADDPSYGGGRDGVIESGTVVVEGNRIVAVGPADRVEVPRGAHVVDASGKFIMPGLVDAHAHHGSASGGLTAETDWGFFSQLAFGVTTTHDPSNSNEMIFTDGEMVAAGMKLGPRIYSTGTILYGAVTPFRSLTRDYEDALMHVRRQKADGAPSVKSYNQRRRDARQWILEAAHNEGINVVPEGGSTLFQNIAQVIDGHTTVEHNLPVATLYDDVLNLWAETEVAYTPTLVVSYGGVSGEYYWYEHENVWENQRLLTFSPRGPIDARSRRRLKMAGDEDYHHIAVARHVNALNQRGVLTNIGAHGQLDGPAAHWEMWMFAQGGMSNLDVIRSATINPARSLGFDADIGSIEEGKLADLLVLEADPLADIRNSDDIELVMVNGRLYDARTLNQVGNHPSQRPLVALERAPQGPKPLN
ncbi:MAG TPA: amidohydrolase family protein [Longimicrobiales bacterium]|nr:amidohydrolase family protein [Longimicrobiales bacterium]